MAVHRSLRAIVHALQWREEGMLQLVQSEVGEQTATSDFTKLEVERQCVIWSPHKRTGHRERGE